MWEHRVIKSGYLGIPNDENLISCPPLSRAFEVCFDAIKSSDLLTLAKSALNFLQCREK